MKDFYRQNEIKQGSYSSKGLIVLGKVTFLWGTEGVYQCLPGNFRWTGLRFYSQERLKL